MKRYVARWRCIQVCVRQSIFNILPALVEIFLVAIFIILLSPVILLRTIVAIFMTGRLFDTQPVIGKHGRKFNLLEFAGDIWGRRLAHSFNILSGQLALVGPELSNTLHHESLSVRPGLVSPYGLRKRIAMANGDKLHVDREYIYQQSFTSNCGILLRSLIGLILSGRGNRATPATIDFFDIPIRNTDMASAVNWIISRSRSAAQSHLAFVNADCLNIAWENHIYKNILKNAECVLPDGIGLNIGCRIQKLSLRENVNGTDLLPRLCAGLVDTGLSVYLLGAKPGVADQMAVNLRNSFPGINICGVQHGYFEESQTDLVIDKINQANPAILLVAMGAPMQEQWIAKHRAQLKARVLVGVGGLFDFYSGQIRRAPLWLREVGMEWCWRILQEPQRMWRRYVIGNPLFLYRVWRYGKKSDSREAHKTAEIIDNRPFLMTAMRRLFWRHSAIRARYLKRAFDCIASLSLLLLLGPFLLLVAICIRLESPGSIIFRQKRIGLGGCEFEFWKFRSMYIDAERRKADLMHGNEMSGGVIFKMRNDPRITRIGRLIRRASIDELPQLWNVLRGDMSLVGPRPCLPNEIREYSVHDRNRLDAEQGITCIWQVSGRSNIPFEQQIKMDIEYVNRASWKQDLLLLLKTVPAVVSGRGAY